MKKIRKYDQKAGEISEVLGVSAKTVRRWARMGTIPHMRLNGRCLRFNLEEVATWMEQRRFKGQI